MDVIVAFMYDVSYEDIKRMKEKFGVGGFAPNLFDWEYAQDPNFPEFENFGGGWGIVFPATKEWQGLLEAIKGYKNSFIVECDEDNAEDVYTGMAAGAVPYFQEHLYLHEKEKNLLTEKIEKETEGKILQLPKYVYAD